MALERQLRWRWLIALYLFLAAAGSGQFLVSFILYNLGLYLPLVKVSLIMGPVVVAIATVFLIIDAGVRTKALQLWALVSNWRASWMARGVIILIVFIIFGLVYSIPALWLDWWYGTCLAIGIIGAIFAVSTAIYTALLIGASKGVPFWNSPVLPPLFFLSALSTGIALSFFVLPTVTMGDKIAALHNLAIADIILIALEIITLYGYLELGRRVNVAFGESVRLLVTGPLAPLFMVAMIGVGLIVPLILEGVSIAGTNYATVATIGVVVGVLLLVGGYLLRDLILRAGVYVPLYPITPR